VFLVFAFASGDGVSMAAVLIFAVVGATDYLDGIAARVTGQYSRLGALLDPLVDRMLIIAGVVVCWHFELLPRWALAILVVREAFMLLVARYGLRHGVDVKINWLGRAGVWPVMGGLFLAMAGVGWPAEACLYLGIALVLGSTAQYVQRGIAESRNR
jgi:phosphatidylglycerophosphate synthase